MGLVLWVHRPKARCQVWGSRLRSAAQAAADGELLGCSKDG